MFKRKRPIEGLGGADPGPGSSPDAWTVYDVDGNPQVTKRRLFRFRTALHNTTYTLYTPSKLPGMSSELLEFILQHEEGFQSRNRLASLYADFRLQLSTNPEGYYANISVWKKALADAARAGKIPAPGGTHDLLNIRTGEDIARALQHPRFGRPTCLSAVFHDAVAKREFLPLHEFLHSPTSVYKTSWLPTPWSALKWGLRKLGVLSELGLGDTLGIGNFVVLKNVEVAAGEVLRRIAEHTYAVDRVLSRSDFLARFADALAPKTKLSQQDLDILLVFLAREKQAISFNASTVKFKAINETVPTPISQEDMAIANLRDTLTKIHAQIPPLEQRVAEMDTATREAVKKGQKVQAKAALRSKKLAESALQQRTDVALQLEGVYAQLQQAADHVEIVEAMRQGAVALKGLNERVGGAEGAGAVVDMMNEEMATTEEITNLINETGQPVDETEIEDEFEALENAEKEKREREEQAERQKRAQEEADELAAKFAEVDKLEQGRKKREKERESATAATAATDATERKVETDMARLSFLDEQDKDQEMKDEDRVPIPA
jgi:charged multivesicular body protein 7